MFYIPRRVFVFTRPYRFVSAVNGKKVTICPIGEGDVLSIGGVEMKLQPVSGEEEARLTQLRTKASSGIDTIANVLLLSVFQALACLGFLLGGGSEYATSIFAGFGGILAAQWALLLLYFLISMLQLILQRYLL